jgi:hypothetical protein
MSSRTSLVIVLVLGLLHPAVGLAVPERDAVVILTQGMPVRVDGATFFEDSTFMAVTIRNGGLEPARVTLRVVVLDDRLRLKGSAAYCIGELLQPGTRVPINFSLEVKTVTTRDRYVVVMEEVRTARRVYRVHEPLAGIIGEATKAAGLEAGRLSSDETPVSRPGSERSLRPPDPLDVPGCACECNQAYAIGEEGCADQGLAAFTCSPSFGSCSQGFSCKPTPN